MVAEKDKQAGAGLWEGILKEVATATKLPDSTLLMLGRPGIGKRTLVQSLLQHACPSAAAAEAHEVNTGKQQSRAVALDFAYFGVRDPEANDAASAHDFVCQACTSVLILEDIKHEKLLRSRLSADRLKHMAALICLDLKEPWTMMEDLRKWLDLLRAITTDLLLELNMGEQDELRTKILSSIENYKEPSGKPRPEGGADAEDGSDGMGDGAGNGGSVSLTCNLGIPCIVTVTRADGASSLETQKTIGWAETIEAYLRSECLSYGAAIVYTMIQAKNQTNVELLYEYLMHRLYGYTFKRKAQVPSRDTLFLPSGWDSREKVDAVAGNLQGGGLDRSFESVVVPPQTQQSEQAPPEMCEDMNVFLKRAAGVLHKLGGTSAAGISRQRTQNSMPVQGQDAAAGGGAAGAPSKRIPTLDGLGGNRRPSQQPPPVGGDGAGAPGTDNSSLANFFQNLLTRGQGGAPGGPPGAAGGNPRVSTMRQSMAKLPSKAGAAPPSSPAAPPGASSPAPAAAPTTPSGAEKPAGADDTKKAEVDV